ncbi:MAG: hypothetical protein LBC96_01195 [Lachnospiraceae bacterium]|jgi:hypothetical protein|nr:hypothetical protein [Lachnospiraceae bacterium]
MNVKYENIDLSDIPEIKDRKKACKNPFYERIMEHGFSITEHYSPEDISSITKGTPFRSIDIMTLDPEEQAALERYNQKHDCAV